MILGCCIPPIYYPFACAPLFPARNFFLILIICTSTLTFLSLFHPTLQSYKFKPYRGIVFVILGVSGTIPMIYLSNIEPNGLVSNYSLAQYLLGGLSYIIGVVFFLTNFPERFKKKRFDIIGSSH